ncbi:MAG TPA: flagellar hook-basal body complex protein FliE [Limnochordia bacterium]|mgnify:CR=1 FL=1|nr:flagellar hook-basal body complex protein FliE [Limnochordia bacterium]
MVDRVGAVARLSETIQSRKSNEGQESASFAKMLADAFDAANQAQWDADQAARLLATGQIEDIHQVTILTEKANLSLQLLISIRNKVIEAYQEISRMQI